VLRDVRLLALADAPTAFASSHEKEATRAISTWDADSSERASGDDSVNFFAEADGTVVGLVGAFRVAQDPEIVELVSMWVEPAQRGRGVGAMLVDAVLEWAAASGSQEVGLWVTRTNASAAALYEKMGFVVTGDVQALPSDPCYDEVRMVRSVGRGDGVGGANA